MEEVIINTSVGILEDVFVYCNEKEWNGQGFLFKCCEGCIHNPILKSNE